MRAIVQVKSGRVEVSQVRDLVGTVERENAALGLFITLEEPTREMRMEATAAAGGIPRHPRRRLLRLSVIV